MRSCLDGQRILVTGANGFIGSHLCHRLCQEGAEVHAVYRSQRPADFGDQRWWQADLADLEQVKKIVGEVRPEVIFHLASHVKGAPGLEHVLPTFQSNLQSTVNLLIVAAETNCRRVILTGSLAEPEVDNGETFPSAPYAAAKWASSGYARMFHALYKLPVADRPRIHGLWAWANGFYQVDSLCHPFVAARKNTQDQQRRAPSRLDLRV